MSEFETLVRSKRQDEPELSEFDPGRYLKLRLTRARTLLRQTINPILAVALECGFGSTSHFSHAYKRAFGISPTVERHRAAPRSAL